MNVLVILGHPGKESYCEALARSYAEGARTSGADVRFLKIANLSFDPILHEGYKVVQELEPDLRRAQQDVLWAQHIVIIYPMWWGSVPALLKGFMDRALLSGFAFKYHASDPMWDKLLKGRSARLIVTSDAPALWVRLVYRSADINMMKYAVLKFCGVSPVRTTRIGGVRLSKVEYREQWLSKVRKLGEKLR